MDTSASAYLDSIGVGDDERDGGSFDSTGLDGAAQILAWLIAASDGACIVNDLLKNGRVVAAVYQTHITRPDKIREIIAEIERVTPDDEMIAVGAAVSSAVMPWLVDQATAPDNRLRSGYWCGGWDAASDPADSMARCRAATDPCVGAVAASLDTVWELAGGDACHQLLLSSSLGFVLGHEKYLTRALWTQHASELAARDILNPEIALLIALRGALGLCFDQPTVVVSGMATMLADAFERRQRESVLVLPPVIV